MSSALYVGAAAQSTLAARLETVANNIANTNTVGFRADGVKFDTLVSTTRGARVAFPSAGQDYLSLNTGATVRTGNQLDLAVRGQSWFSLMGPSGPIYTRDGRFTLSPTGELKSVNGYQLLDASGGPIFADPGGGEISVAADGAITQAGKQLGAVGLFMLDPAAHLTRVDNSSVSSDLPSTPALEFTTNGVAQGYLEQSNVDPIREITRLIQVQRAFESITSSMETLDSSEREAIRTLGSQS